MIGGFPVYAFRAGAQAEHDARQAKRTAREFQGDMRELEQRVNSLVLACTAMWSLLAERTGVTQEELAARIREIDLMDGKEDGKIGRAVQKCEKCGHTMSPKHSRCLYCGSEDLSRGPFEASR